MRSLISACLRPDPGIEVVGAAAHANGLLAMRMVGARTLGQNEATCVVYGLRKAAVELGAVEREAPLNALSGLVLDACEVRARIH
ncbi:Protein-glutamate methylesterase/protein-glutamine glutaminase [Caulobacter sp. NIBR1757]|nr:Protein-glutamate methylesterase/protein-glutamine glutaminase [Caulobacter sp. NIBR1757]